MDAQSPTNEEHRPGLLQRAWNELKQYGNEVKQGWQEIKEVIAADQKKWGGMTFSAMFRLGMAELREAFSLGGNITQPTPYGMYGTLTPGEVGAARDNDPKVPEMEEEPRMNDNQPLPSPSQIAEGQSPDSLHGQSQQVSMQDHPSPASIAEQPGQSQQQQQGQGLEQTQSRGRGM